MPKRGKKYAEARAPASIYSTLTPAQKRAVRQIENAPENFTFFWPRQHGKASILRAVAERRGRGKNLDPKGQL